MLSIETLGRSPLFERLDEAQLQRVAAHAHTIKRAVGETVIEQGAVASHFFLLLSGQIKLYRLSPDGNEKVFEIITPPATFGEALMFNENPHYPVSASVLRAAELVVIDGADFTAMLRDSVDTCFALLGSMSQRLHRLVHEIDHLTLHSASCRVAGFIYEHTGEHEPEFELGVSKGVLASRLSVTPETLSRLFRQLSDRGIIRVSGRRVAVLDRRALERTTRDA